MPEPTHHDNTPSSTAFSEPFADAMLAHAGTRHAVTVRGRSMFWRRFGAGPNLLLVHGGHGDWRHWIRNIDALAEQHTVWLPDLPGFGDSDDLNGHAHASDRMDHLVQALAAAVESLIRPTAPLDLAGFSFGGLVAAQLALRLNVDRLVLLGPAGHGGMRRQTVTLTDWRMGGHDARKTALRQNLSTFMLHDAALADDQAGAIYESQCARTRFRSKAISLAGGLTRYLDQLQIPVLLAWGEYDVTAQPQQVGPQLVLGHALRQWQLVRDAGHWVQYERPDVVNTLLVDWFAPVAMPQRGGQRSFHR